MVGEVKRWWSGCEGVCSWLGEVEESMFSHKPLACSADIIEKQRADVKVRHPLFVASTPELLSTMFSLCHYHQHQWWLDDVTL